MSVVVPRLRVLLADVTPTGQGGATAIGWQVFNDGDAPISVRCASAPDPQFESASTSPALEIASHGSERLEMHFILGTRELGSEFRDAHLVLDVDQPGAHWRVVVTLEGRFGPGGVVLPRTTGTHVERRLVRLGDR